MVAADAKQRLMLLRSQPGRFSCVANRPKEEAKFIAERRQRHVGVTRLRFSTAYFDLTTHNTPCA